MRAHIATSCTIAALLSGPAVAGPLTPPGAPAPTMKTLEQVEPRIPLDAVPGDADTLHRITQPGSYYLTGDVAGPAAGQEGIIIEAPGVTLDLSGFTVDGAGVGGEGILITGAAESVVIRNGFVRNWGAGGVVAFSSNGNVVVEDIAAAGNVFEGVLASGPNSTIRRCVASRNSTGLRVGLGGLIEHSAANENTGTGVLANSGSIIRSTVSSNSGFEPPAAHAPIDDEALARRLDAGIEVGPVRAFSPGFNIGPDSLVIDCLSRASGGIGFLMGSRSTIEHSTASSNTLDGIAIGADSTVKGVTASGNGERGLTGDSGQVVTDSTFTRNGADGVWLNIGSLISNCAVTANQLSGVSIRSWSFVEGNMIQGNGVASGAVAGILIRDNGASNRIDNNHLVSNPWGIRTEPGPSGNTLNIVIRNTVRLADALNQQVSLPGNGTVITNVTSPGTSLNYANIIQ